MRFEIRYDHDLYFVLSQALFLLAFDILRSMVLCYELHPNYSLSHMLRRKLIGAIARYYSFMRRLAAFAGQQHHIAHLPEGVLVVSDFH